MQRFEPVLVGVVFEHREIHHPEEVPGLSRHHLQLFGQVLAHPIESLVHRGGIAGAEQDQTAGLGAGALQ